MVTIKGIDDITLDVKFQFEHGNKICYHGFNYDNYNDEMFLTFSLYYEEFVKYKEEGFFAIKPSREEIKPRHQEIKLVCLMEDGLTYSMIFPAIIDGKEVKMSYDFKACSVKLCLFDMEEEDVLRVITFLNRIHKKNFKEIEMQIEDVIGSMDHHGCQEIIDFKRKRIDLLFRDEDD